MNISQLAIESFKELKANGGSTINGQCQNLIGQKLFATGVGREKVLEPNAKNVLSEINAHIIKNKDILNNSKYALGTWLDPKTGKAYLDIVLTDSEQLLIETVARDHRELAIFDLAKCETIYLNNN